MTKQELFIDEIANVVQKHNSQYRILNSLTIAQACLESSYGTSSLATKGKALFGIKADKNWNGKVFNKDTKECYDGKNFVTINAGFRAYNSWEESIIDHYKFLQKDRYKKLIGETDYKKACKYIYECGYATDINYTSKLIDLIEKYKLYKYDQKHTIETNVRLADKSNYTCGRAKKIEYIVIHYTANDGDTDEGNGKYFQGKNRGASAHYFVDEDSITLSVNESDTAWHCGAKKYVHKYCRNDNSIGIEMCSDKVNGKFVITPDTIKNTVRLVKDLMTKYNIPISNIIRHYDVSHKVCPEPFVRNENLWNDFVNQLKNNKTISNNIDTVDDGLFKAVQKIIKSGISIDFNSWKRMDLFNMKNVPSLISKLGGIDTLIKKGMISNADIWKNNKYNENHVRSLLIKFASKL